jgi:hypothetical protein
MTAQGETWYMILSERLDGGRMLGRLAVGSPWEAGAVFCCF